MTEGTPQSTEQPEASKRRLAALISGYQVSAALGALARLGVADALADGPESITELSRRLGADERALARLLDATLDVGLFTIGDDERYRLGELGDLLRSDAPGLDAALCDRIDRALALGRLWSPHTHPAYRRARLRRGPRLSPLGLLAAHPEAAASFEESMARVGVARDRAVATAVDFSTVVRLVDVGGGRGGLLRALLAVCPHLRGVVFDLPAVIEGAREQLNEAGIAERCEAIAGDFREAVPSGGDAYLLSWILHDWDDATALRILGNCRAAMEKGSRLLVVEMIVPEPSQPNAAVFERLIRQADLEMLAVVGGRERTAAEYEGLFTESGFVLSHIVPLASMPWSVIEGSAV